MTEYSLASNSEHQSEPEEISGTDLEAAALESTSEPTADYVYEVEGVLPMADIMPCNDPLAFADEQLQNLALALDFGPDDLAYNHEGELSPAQIARLEEDINQFYWPMIGGLALIACVIALVGMFTGQLLALPAVLFAVLMVIPVTLLRMERERLPDRQVQRTLLRMGTLSLVARRWGLSDERTLPTAGDKPIFAPHSLYKVLQANRVYILYYTPVRTWRGYRLLSLEPAESDYELEKPKRKAKRG